MTIRHPLRLAAVATLTALAGFGARAIEADQWESRADVRQEMRVNTDALREPLAWTVSRHEATEFHDAMSRDTMASRDAVRQELAAARAHGVAASTGEAGASEDVWRLRDGFAAAGQDPAVASAADPIAEIAAASASTTTAGVPTAEAGGSMYSLAPDGTAHSGRAQ